MLRTRMLGIELAMLQGGSPLAKEICLRLFAAVDLLWPMIPCEGICGGATAESNPTATIRLHPSAKVWAQQALLSGKPWRSVGMHVAGDVRGVSFQVRLSGSVRQNEEGGRVREALGFGLATEC
eukprot:scaffold51090_cov20-Tisochrysis_lutea.AAC.1